MELKQYQQKTLDELRKYLTALEAARAKKDQIEALQLDLDYNAPLETWKKVRGKDAKYNARQNGLGEDLPSICLKVPTGGGKTILATLAIDLINLAYRKERTGFVLWIVPTTQIYRQTLTSLRTREHPYRQALDRASGGRTLILEKTDRFTPQQLQEYLVIMLLMLPSANRRDKETLKVFQDSSGFDAFFPTEDNAPAQAALLKEYGNLDHFGEAHGWAGLMVKTSLGNVLRVIRPLVIIDEGHKTYSEGAQDTIRSFNPCFVLELSATPTEDSNVLVVISGQELDREEMIKLDLNITNKASQDWKDTLLAGFEQIKRLDEKAREHQSNGGRYIRPICLVQVERTGKDQDDGRHIHANDAKNFLINQCSVSPQSVAIKSSETDGLEDVDLLSPDCHIQYIITKQALQEGWDCAFAYVLVILTNPRSQRGTTQLIGRILRQPHAKKTKVKELDESYVFSFQPGAGELLRAIREGFASEGLGDLTHRTKQVTDGGVQLVEVQYRQQFKKFEGKIYLPHFVIQQTHDFRELSYDMDILSRIDWGQVDLEPLKGITIGMLGREDRKSRVGLSDEPLRIADEKEATATEAALDIDKVFMTQQISDIVPNPWVAYDIVSETLTLFLDKHSEKQVAADLVLIIDELKKLLMRERDKLAQQVFRDLIGSKHLVFLLQAITDYELPRTIRVNTHAPKLIRDNNDPIQRSLFEYYPEEEFNETEKAVAIYLDKQTKLLFWYRNMVGKEYYSIQGWQKHRIYPDFITTLRDPDDGTDYSKIYVLETKGLHLKGNADTAYKENIFELCNHLGRETDWEAISQEFGRKKIEFRVIYEDEWEVKINELFV